MAASYQTGTATSPVNLLQTLVTWLVAQGWTQDRSASEGTGWWATLHKGGQYVNLRAANDEKIWVKDDDPSTIYWDRGQGYGIGLYLGDGYSGAVGWGYQSGRPQHVSETGYPDTAIGAGMNLPSGPIAAYHFFDDGADHVVVVVEKTPGIFVHMGWGPSLVKIGYSADYWYFWGSSDMYENTYTGSSSQQGQDVTAAAPMSHTQAHNMGTSVYLISTAFVRVDSAVFSDRWVGNGCYQDWRYSYTGRWMRSALCQNLDSQSYVADTEYPAYYLLHDNPENEGRVHQSAFPGALLLPLHNYVWREPASRWAPIGYPPTVFWTTAVGHGWTQGEIYQVGGVDYMVFPNFAVKKAA